MRIEKIEIKGFRSIYNQTIKASDFNIFVGLNDSGKSNILKALNLFFNNETGWGEKFNFEHDYNIKSKEEFEQNKKSDKPKNKAKNIIIKLTFSKQGEVIPVWRKEWREDGLHRDGESRFDKNIAKTEREKTGFKASSKIPEKLNKIQYYYVPAVKSSEFIGSLIGKLSDVLSEKASKDIRDAAGNFEKNIKKRITNVFENIEKELDITSSLQLPDNLNAIFSQMQFSDDRNIGLSRRGDGIRTRHIPILLEGISTLHKNLKLKGAIHDHFIWGYEEPENNVEIKKCYEMAKQLHGKSRKHQIFLTTHSPAFYSLPLKVNENWKQYENGIYRYYAEYENEKTEYAPVEEAKLDNNFLLPMVSEIMNEKNSEIDEKNEIIKKYEKENIFSTHHFFVEGISDEIIFKKTISLFYPIANKQIIVKERNGADGVCESLLAWHGYFKRLKLNDKDKKNAYGYFDNDNEGIEKKRKFEEQCRNKEYAIPIIYSISNKKNHISELQNYGMKISCTLEDLYPPHFWKFAYKKGMLVQRTADELETIIDEAGMKEIVHSNKSIEDWVNERLKNNKKLSLFVTHKFDHYQKKEAAEIINQMNDRQAKKCTEIIAAIIKNQILKLVPDAVKIENRLL